MLATVRVRQDKLRAYVPGAVVEALDGGGELDSRQCDLTVMFVDIEGYSRFSEGRALEQVFTFISQYTEVVSSIVRAQGGQIVEFNGDGMMAVFGAPQPLDGKEDRALRAALEITSEIASTEIDSGGRPLRVGVGIATGHAYVGTIRAIDRSIWTALGETTNRAARLQALTRDLAAAIVVDATTWRALGSKLPGFVRYDDQRLRGLQRPHDLYVQPLEAKRVQ